MSTSRDLRTGTAQALHDAGVGTYKPSGKYTTSDSAPVFFSKMPTTPDRCLVVTVYPQPAPHQWAIQVRCRGPQGATVSAEDLADEVRDALHGLTDLTWGATGIDLLSVASVARLGFDAQDRDEVAVNLRAVTSDPATALMD